MRRRQRGVALITAVLIVALVTAVAVAMASRQQVDIRRSANIFNNDAAYLFALGAEDYARNVLQWDGDPNKGDPNVDHLGENWAQTVSVPVEGAMLSGSMEDMQGRFNLNALVDSNGQAPNQAMVDRFKHLLRLLDLDEAIAEAVVDWIDENTTPQQNFGGAEDEFYALQDTPYRSANTFMASASELRLVRGVDAEAYQKLIPLVTALPVADTAINVNTAPAEVLAALHNNMTLQDGAELVKDREGSEFTDKDQFINHNQKTNQIDPSLVAVNSSYYLLNAVAEYDQTVAHLHSLLRRDGTEVTVLMRSRGAF